jgi:hypothetical protein
VVKECSWDRSEVKAFSAAARWRLKEVILWEIITSELCKKNVKKDSACDGEVFFLEIKEWQSWN